MEHPITQLNDNHNSYGANQIGKGIDVSVREKDLAEGSVFFAQTTGGSGHFTNICRSAEGTPGSIAGEEGIRAALPGKAMPGGTRVHCADS